MDAQKPIEAAVFFNCKTESIQFVTEGAGVVGSLYFGTPMKFEGDVGESVRVFFNCLTDNDGDGGGVNTLMHRLEIHPDYEYAKTVGPRKAFDEHPPAREGWERNIHRGRNGWERFATQEEAYWMRQVNKDNVGKDDDGHN